jgi:hypothetical protein
MTISTISDNMLDSALGQLQAGETITRVLGSYPGYADSLGPLLEATSALKAIDPVEVPTYQAMTPILSKMRVMVLSLGLRCRPSTNFAEFLEVSHAGSL